MFRAFTLNSIDIIELISTALNLLSICLIGYLPSFSWLLLDWPRGFYYFSLCPLLAYCTCLFFFLNKSCFRFYGTHLKVLTVYLQVILEHFMCGPTVLRGSISMFPFLASVHIFYFYLSFIPHNISLFCFLEIINYLFERFF